MGSTKELRREFWVFPSQQKGRGDPVAAASTNNQVAVRRF